MKTVSINKKPPDLVLQGFLNQNVKNKTTEELFDTVNIGPVGVIKKWN